MHLVRHASQKVVQEGRVLFSYDVVRPNIGHFEHGVKECLLLCQVRPLATSILHVTHRVCKDVSGSWELGRLPLVGKVKRNTNVAVPHYDQGFRRLWPSAGNAQGEQGRRISTGRCFCFSSSLQTGSASPRLPLPLLSLTQSSSASTRAAVSSYSAISAFWLLGEKGVANVSAVH